ncbi:transaldolase [Acidimicrobium ferrooxidans DSM 10331]|uniref:Transaldolase n=1 Tax=Acidimicrobium ferrooxidans (strain DSM 10331 / JCM 15462 / NBRC 103882 / ICP) TaxID=525909 RepID=C7LYY9_ACIFD|nr:transaldolase [Acidimicrobium ferrooxidans]ACU53947.1 transaldolase [Acidimicrobium ferrooxidans DSM 10331]
MKRARLLAEHGQSVWLDAISRRLLAKGTLAHYIDELAVTGLTSNPSILSHAIAGSTDYDERIADAVARGVHDPEAVVYELAHWDLAEAAGLFAPVYERTDGVDGYVSIEVPPQYAHDTQATLSWARELRSRFAEPNVLVKVPGTPEGLPAISELIASGIGVNVTLLFSVEHYTAAAEAYLEGIERRSSAGLSLVVPSVASVFVSRWDSAVDPLVPRELQGRTGLAIMRRIYAAYQALLASERFSRLAGQGARAQRLLWASTSTKNPELPDTYYLGRLVAPGTIDTVPEGTLLAFDDHGEIEPVLDDDLAGADALLEEVASAGVDLAGLGDVLQEQGAHAFSADWTTLLDTVARRVKG